MSMSKNEPLTPEQLNELQSDIINDLDNFYEEYEGRGRNPKEFDLYDVDVRSEGREFKQRQAIRDANDKARKEALARHG
ncbi:hypothetical protein EniLVp02_0042 [Vibrio phage EniLVp02]